MVPLLVRFLPQGSVAAGCGALRGDGTSEGALFVIDKKGMIRYIDIHDINKRPPLEDPVRAMEKVNKGNR